MSLSEELYRETILDHYHNPRNQGVMDKPTVEVEGVNPLCGDELTLYLNVDKDKIEDIRIKSRGCSINTASGSMMTEAIKGQDLEGATQLAESFKNMLLSKDATTEFIAGEDMEDLEALQGVKKYPVRIKCALLPWNTLLEGIQSLKSHDGDIVETIKPQVVTTE
ncbi:MAG: SUF system NifU family Fe-S cluster assembly protein [Candidatus Obscuribacterales bacterium]